MSQNQVDQLLKKLLRGVTNTQNVSIFFNVPTDNDNIISCHQDVLDGMENLCGAFQDQSTIPFTWFMGEIFATKTKPPMTGWWSPTTIYSPMMNHSNNITPPTLSQWGITRCGPMENLSAGSVSYLPTPVNRSIGSNIKPLLPTLLSSRWTRWQTSTTKISCPPNSNLTII